MPTILTFTSTIHDPEGRLKWLIEEVGRQLREYFDSAYVAYTPNTHPSVVKELNDEGYQTLKAGDTVASTYQTALKQPIRKDPERILYCDFDRALHWIQAYPEEFKQLSTINSDHDFILIGRTQRAFDTHPETQTMTEGIGNMVASKILGFSKTRDILGTTWILTRELATLVTNRKSSNAFGFYTDWPMTFWRSAKNPSYIEMEGLEWETTDRYKEEIRTQGFENWKTRFQTPQEWVKRTKMLRDFIESTYH